MSDDLTFASAGVAGVHYARCDACMCGSHSGGWHTWAGPEDVQHALATGQADPSDKRCACDCSTRDPEPDDPDDPDIEITSLTTEPCPLCGEAGPCGYDAEGRPMIHTDVFEDES